MAMNPGLLPLGVPPPGMLVSPMVVNPYGGPNPLLSTLGQIPLPTSAPPSQEKLPETAMIPPGQVSGAPPSMDPNLPDKLLDSDIIMEDAKKGSGGPMRLSDELLATMNSGPPPSAREGRERRPRRDRWERSPEDQQWRNREEFSRPQPTSVQERLRNLAHGDYDGGR